MQTVRGFDFRGLRTVHTKQLHKLMIDDLHSWSISSLHCSATYMACSRIDYHYPLIKYRTAQLPNDVIQDEQVFICEFQGLRYSMDENEISTRLNSDSNDPGFQLMTDDEICA